HPSKPLQPAELPDNRRKRSRDDGRIQRSQQHRQQQTAEDDENLTVGESLLGDRLWGIGGGEGDGTRTAGGYQQPVSSGQLPANAFGWSPAAGSWLLQVGCSSPAPPTHLSPRSLPFFGPARHITSVSHFELL